MKKENNPNEKDLIDLINEYKDVSNEGPEAINRILFESKGESIKTVFGDELAPVLLSSLSINATNMKDNFDAQEFLVRLNETLKDDAFHIQKMIEGKLLTKYHAGELRKKMALPRLDDF